MKKIIFYIIVGLGWVSYGLFKGQGKEANSEEGSFLQKNLKLILMNLFLWPVLIPISIFKMFKFSESKEENIDATKQA